MTAADVRTVPTDLAHGITRSVSDKQYSAQSIAHILATIYRLFQAAWREEIITENFHSTRRAFSQALARANVNEQTAMSLTGHNDSKVHQRYLESVTVRALAQRHLSALIGHGSCPIEPPEIDFLLWSRGGSNP